MNMKLLALYLDGKIIIIFFFGIVSGIALPLTGLSVLSVMLKEQGVSLLLISQFSLASIPYSLKYLWAPLLDYYTIPLLRNFLGQRYCWLPITQILLGISVYFLGAINITSCVYCAGLIALLISFFSATQDILVDAFRIEFVSQEQQGIASSASVFGYRLGMFISSALPFYIATYFNWFTVYLFFGIIIALSSLVTIVILYVHHRENPTRSFYPESLSEAFISPVVEFFKRFSFGVIVIFILIITYKLSDAYLGNMTNILLMELGFAKIEIAEIIKVYGTAATFIGMVLGGCIVAKLNIYKSLMIGVILQIISNLGYLWQYYAGYSLLTLFFVNSIENICGGIGNTILVVYLSSLCNLQFVATQYAILTSLAGLGRVFIASTAGAVVEKLGWPYFIAMSLLLSIPAIFCILFLQARSSIVNSQKSL